MEPRTHQGFAWLAPAIVGLALLIAPAALAAPPMQDCAGMHPDDSGERMKCLYGNLMVQQEETTDMLMMMGQLSEISESQMDRLHKMMDRNTRAMERIPGEDFRQLVRKRTSRCGVAPLDPMDEDGICKGNEECEEVIGDGIGDDIQPCKTKGKPSDREVCVEICEEQGITDPRGFDDDPTDPTNLGADMEEEITDITEEYAEVNEMLAEEIRLRAAAQAFAMDPNASDCDIAINAIAQRSRDDVAVALLILAETVNVLEQICDAAGDFHIGPVPAKVVCSIGAVAAGVTQVLSDLRDNRDGNIDSATMDATVGCVQDLLVEVGSNNDLLDDVLDDLATVKGELMIVREQLDTTIRLLNTPPGRRESFPQR